MSEWEKLKAECEECQRCPKLVRSRQTEKWGKPVFGYGALNSPVVLIGEAPGRLGAGRTGIPFMGDKSGDFLDWCLSEIGLDREKIYITNIVKCLPKSNKGNNRKPNGYEINQCIKYLVREIELIKPKRIICLGKTAYDNIIDKSSWYPTLREPEIIRIDHPSYIYNYQGGKPGTLKASQYLEELTKALTIYELKTEETEALNDLFRLFGKIARDDSYWEDDLKTEEQEE